MRIYPDQSYRIIREAEDALKKMESANSTDLVKRSFSTFIGSTKLIFFPIKNIEETKNLIEYQKWWKSKSDSLLNNKLSKFFYRLRNENLKAGIDVLSVSFEIKGPTSFGPTKPGNVIQISSQFGINEVPKQLSKTFPKEDIKNLKITSIKFDISKCSSEFKRKFSIFHGTDVLVFLKQYLDYLKKIVDEYTDKFGSL
jgi:hypothetical protein